MDILPLLLFSYYVLSLVVCYTVFWVGNKTKKMKTDPDDKRLFITAPLIFTLMWTVYGLYLVQWVLWIPALPYVTARKLSAAYYNWVKGPVREDPVYVSQYRRNKGLVIVELEMLARMIKNNEHERIIVVQVAMVNEALQALYGVNLLNDGRKSYADLKEALDTPSHPMHRRATESMRKIDEMAKKRAVRDLQEMTEQMTE